MAPKRSATAAAAAVSARDSKRPRRQSGAPGLQPGAQPAEAASDRRTSADTKRALVASRLQAFDAYHTEVLWAWGADHAGWTLPRADTQRSAILSALSETPGVHMPGGEGDMRKCWRRVMRTGKGATFPTLDAQADRSGSGSDSEANDHEEAARAIPAPSPQNEQILALQRTVAELAARLTTSSPRAPSAPPPAPVHAPPMAVAAVAQATCSLCLTPQLVSDPSHYRCATCGQKPHLGFAHPENAFLRDLHTRTLAASSSSGNSASGQSHTAQTATPSPQPTKRDKEYERLAGEGPQLPDYATAAPVAAADALQTSRLSYAATEYSPASASLLKLVQSGHLMKVGHALPRALAAANSQTDYADAVLIMQNGRMAAADAVSAPPLTSLRDFCSAFFGTIAPALIAQPKALAQWFALARTLVALDDRHDWPTAHAYLEMLLSDRVHRAASIADYDPRMVDSAVRGRGVHASAAAHGSVTHQPAALPGSGGGVTGGGAYAFSREACKDWNTRGCVRGALCQYKHQCAWPGCTASNRNHIAADCPAKPTGWLQPSPRGGSSVMSTRGGRGGRGRHATDARGGAASTTPSLPDRA